MEYRGEIGMSQVADLCLKSSAFKNISEIWEQVILKPYFTLSI